MSLYGADPVLAADQGISSVCATAKVQLGTVIKYDGEHYEYVYSLGEISQGYGCVYSGTSGHSVVATGAVSGEHCAGFVKHATLTTGTYGWILKKGVVDALNGMTGSAPTVNQVVMLATDGKFRTIAPNVAATSATDAIGGHVIGKVLSAGASGGTGASFSLLYVNV